MKQWQQWWQSLQQREQQLVSVAAGLIFIALLYSLIWQPITQQHTSQQQAAAAATEQLNWLKTKLPLLSQAGPTVRSSGSLNEVVAQTARQFNIQVSRMQPQNEQLQLSLDDVAFNQLMRWVDLLQQQHGVQLVQLDIAVTEQPGMVRVRRMLLE